MRLTLWTLTLCAEVWEAFISVQHWSPSSLRWAEIELVIFTSPQSSLVQQIQEQGDKVKVNFYCVFVLLILLLFLSKQIGTFPRQDFLSASLGDFKRDKVTILILLKHCYQCFPTSSSQLSFEVEKANTSFGQRRKLRCTQIKWLIQGNHTS